MKTELNAFLLLKKMIKEFEKTNGTLSFKFKKKNTNFIITDINSLLLNALGAQRNEFIGQDLANIDYIGDDLNLKLNVVYPLAWNGQTVAFYCTPITKNNIFFIVTLTPIIYDNKVTEVVGICIPLDKKEYKKVFATLKDLKSFVVLEK
jgi:hypothetical protein